MAQTKYITPSVTPSHALAAFQWAAKQGAPSTQKMVLAMLAWHSDPATNECRIGVQALARVSGLSESGTKSALKGLECLGLIEIRQTRQDVAIGPNSYALSMGQSVPPLPIKKEKRVDRSPISPAKRERIYARDGYACVCCGATDDLTLDHIHPVSKGGRNDDANLQTMCRNAKKGARVTAAVEVQQ